jgi:hypothetical protein
MKKSIRQQIKTDKHNIRLQQKKPCKNNTESFQEILMRKEMEIQMEKAERDINERFWTIHKRDMFNAWSFEYSYIGMDDIKTFYKALTERAMNELFEIEEKMPYSDCDDTCPITLCRIRTLYTTSCNHKFEKSAILEHLKLNDSCPLCRKQLKENSSFRTFTLLPPRSHLSVFYMVTEIASFDMTDELRNLIEND